jgi:hypothetical protein
MITCFVCVCVLIFLNSIEGAWYVVGHCCMICSGLVWERWPDAGEDSPTRAWLRTLAAGAGGGGGIPAPT